MKIFFTIFAFRLIYKKISDDIFFTFFLVHIKMIFYSKIRSAKLEKKIILKYIIMKNFSIIIFRCVF